MNRFLLRTKPLINKSIKQRNITELLSRIKHSDREKDVAIIDNSNKQKKIWTYKELYDTSIHLAIKIKSSLPKNVSIVGGFHKGEIGYILSMLACWHLKFTFVPLSPSHPEKELNYFVNDSKLSAILHSLPDDNDNNIKMLSRLGGNEIKLISVPSILQEPFSNSIINDTNSNINSDCKGALIVYTSGTTGQPKGVLHTRNGVQYMIESLVNAWKYDKNDLILHFLPLHHIHGILNKLLCVLYAGGGVEFFHSANALSIWKRLALEGKKKEGPYLSIFMGVPTVYSNLLEEEGKKSFELTKEDIELSLIAMKRMRFMACGSAALPDPIMNSWKNLTGHTLLERYGMTELGMVLSNPLEGIRHKGHVGKPLPYVECRLVDDNEEEITSVEAPGELRVKGPCVFKEYYNRPEETIKAFDKFGWFKTGDIAIININNDYRLLGRNSTDILKSAGYKLSALEIERELLSHPEIKEVAVIGVKDDQLGEKIVAIITIRKDINVNENDPTSNSSRFLRLSGFGCDVDSDAEVTKSIHIYLKDKLANYKHPRKVIVVSNLPRNLLGKINKKTLLSDLSLFNV